MNLQVNIDMKTLRSLAPIAVPMIIGMLSQSHIMAQASPAQAEGPYKVINTADYMGTGRTDYVYADGDNRHLYIPRGNSVLVYDLDTLKPLTPIPGLVNGHGVAVDPVANHGFSTSRPLLMWDAKTLKTIKTIDVAGGPDGILFEPLTERIYVLSHMPPNITVLDGKDGSIVGTIDLGAAPEQSASDGQGNVYVDLEDKDGVAVVDAKALKVTGTYSLSGKGSGPAGLGLDIKNQVLYAFCRKPAVAVILSATDGTVFGTEPIGAGTDGGGFNQETGEAFASAGDGTVTFLKQTAPGTFTVEQTVKTILRARTCTLDTKTNHVIVIATDRPAAPSAAPGASPATTGTAGGGERERGGPGGLRGFGGGPGLLHIVVVGQQ
jgi:DNA-binding beta-propeller fold protein YncE